MVRYNKFIAIGILFAAVVGCQQDSLPNSQYVPSSDPVDFSTSVWDSVDTKGTILEGFESGDVVGVYAYYVPNDGSSDMDDSSPNFMYNQLLEKQDDNSWTYSPTKYWPNNVGSLMYFFGYAPYNADEYYSGYHTSKNGYPIFVHQSATTMTETSDFILAGSKYDEYTDKVLLEFEHMLTKLRFKFRNSLIDSETATYTMVVRSISLINATTRSTFTFLEQEDAPNGAIDIIYAEGEEWDTGTIVADIESGALIGGVDFDGDGVPDLFGVDTDDDSNAKPDIVYDENGYIVYDQYTSITGDLVLKDVDFFGEDKNRSGYSIYDPSQIYTTDAVTIDNDCFIESNGEELIPIYTDITMPGQFMFIDPHLISDNVILSLEVELYTQVATGGYVEKTLMATYEPQVRINEIIAGGTVTQDDGTEIVYEPMQRGNSYVIEISYQPIPGSGLFVNVVGYWEDIYIEHEI
ncbi:MAG: fimbrillin family protein [Rikenellaceae bacterium]